MLAMRVEPGVLVTLIPVGIVVLGFITFEMAMAITISTLPRSRFQQKWTPQEQRRVLRVFAAVFCVWPIFATLVVAHVYLPLIAALVVDGLMLALFILGVRWIARGVYERKLVLAGHCASCFYDLRASKAQDHCPECGIELHDHPTRKSKTSIPVCHK